MIETEEKYIERRERRHRGGRVVIVFALLFWGAIALAYLILSGALNV